jgi:hypothetical protein
MTQQIDGDDAPHLRQACHVRVPGAAAAGESMQQHERRSIASHENSVADAIDFKVLEGRRYHD